MSKIKKHIAVILSALSLFMIASSFNTHNVKADSNPASWILCKFEDGEMLYNAATTDLIPYMFRSKSALASTDKIDNIYNKLLGIAGYDFKGVNEEILGREINANTISEEHENANDEAPKVNIFDRFGLAGLKWSSYAGEWKYYYINACSEANSVSKTNYGKFYEDRLEPKSTYKEVKTSADPRSQQFSRGVIASWGASVSDLTANIMFSITKTVVALTITFVGLSFTDITTIVGFSDGASAGIDAVGLFTDLFNSVFKGFVILTFGLTALYLLYNGLIKRQFRMAINTAIKTVLIFLVAIVMSTNPAFWISVPNKAATYGQALVLNSMSSVQKKNNKTSLCSSEVGQIIDPNKIDFKKGTGALNKEMAQVSKNMQSAIGCAMWERMLFRPWVKGQFGVDYEDLDASKLKNVNSEWVGVPEVPVGGGETIDNWAVFQLSTQTNAHDPLGEVKVPKYVTGVNADWWRVVDALSNYDEEEVQTDPVGDVGSLTYTEQKDTKTTPVWEHWVGNHRTSRSGIALLSIVFGILGSIGPLVLGLSSAVYGLGITILMIVSPVFMLMGTWGGRGDGQFKGWLEALISTIGKKLATSVLLIFSLSLTMTAMDLIDRIGWVTAIILLTVTTIVFTRNRKQILDAMTNVNIGGTFNPRSGFNRALETQKSRAKRVTSVAQGAVGGAVAGHETGQGAMRGLKEGAMSQLRNTWYQTEFGRDVAYGYSQVEQNVRSAQYRYCKLCGVQIDKTHKVAYRSRNGDYYCFMCGDEMDAESGIVQVSVKDDPGIKDEDDGVIRDTLATKNASWLSHSAAKDMMKVQINKKGNIKWDNEGVENMIKHNIKQLHRDIVVFKFNKKRMGENAMPPTIPEPLQDYLDLAVINEAWTDEDYKFIDQAYRQAWAEWHKINAAYVQNADRDKLKAFQEEIIEVAPAFDPTNAIMEFTEGKFKPDKEDVYEHDYYKFNKDMELEAVEIEESNDTEVEISRVGGDGEDEEPDDDKQEETDE